MLIIATALVATTPIAKVRIADMPVARPIVGAPAVRVLRIDVRERPWRRGIRERAAPASIPRDLTPRDPLFTVTPVTVLGVRITWPNDIRRVAPVIA
jgi:hypothetical protein